MGTLDYLSSGKGMIPYQMITDFGSLKKVPQEDFFQKKDFYSELKEKDISDEEYQNVKRFFMLLRLKTLGDMNRVYNFQDTLIYAKFSNKELHSWKNFLNLILESAIVRALFQVLSTETKVNVTLSSLETPNKLEFLKRL